MFDLTVRSTSFCPLNAVGSSDHFADVTYTALNTLGNDHVQRMMWFWGKGYCKSAQTYLHQINWSAVSTGNIEEQVSDFTFIICDL